MFDSGGSRPAVVLVDRPLLSSGIEPLLRRRLLIVTVLASATAAFFSIYRATLPEQFEYFRASPSGRGVLVFEAAFMLLSAVAAIALWRRATWSLRALRAIEFGIIAGFGIYIAWSQLFAWAGARFVLDSSAGVDTFILRQAVDSMAGRWVALIVGISTLIPETWRRNTALVGTLACTALASTTYLALTDPLYRPHLWTMLSLMTFWMVIATTIAVFGSYKLAELRQQVHQARKLGQYRLVRKIGSGGMGEVHLAEHLMLKQPCAIKLIRPERAGDPAAMYRFEREVQATSRLKHWNTVQIYDYGYAEDGTFYYAMEYLPGLTLEQLVRRHGPLPPGRALHLLRQICAALREAHAMGLIHRDIKPANIIACERGGVYDVAKLLDFGLVRTAGLAGRAETLTTDGLLAGTPAYMSPEQVSGRDVDPRSDIYSVGCVAYFLLTGREPFVRENAFQVIVAHVQDPVQRPADVWPGVPPDVEAVILRCLEKSPADRFPAVVSLDDALAACAAWRWTPADAEAWWRARAEDTDATTGFMRV